MIGHIMMKGLDECRAQGLDDDDSEPDLEEEFQCTDEDLECDNELINIELQCLKNRVNELQKCLKISMPECPPIEPCIDLEVELNCSKNKEIHKLQVSNHKLQCQICEVSRTIQVALAQIREMDARMCQEKQEIIRMKKTMEAFDSWKLQLEHKFALCIERFEYLKTTKCEWLDCVTLATEMKEAFNSYCNKVVPQVCFKAEKCDLIKKVSDLRLVCINSFVMLENQLKRIERCLKKKGHISKTKSTYSTSKSISSKSCKALSAIYSRQMFKAFSTSK